MPIPAAVEAEWGATCARTAPEPLCNKWHTPQQSSLNLATHTVPRSEPLTPRAKMLNAAIVCIGFFVRKAL